MKKLLIAVAFAALALPVVAQDDDASEAPAAKYSVATASFWSNWFVQGGLSASSFYGDKGNAPGASLPSGLFRGFRSSMGLSFALGKWFTPGLGLRTALDGFWGRQVVGTDKSANATKYWTLSEQLLFNLSNMYAGYSDSRRWNLIPYLSAGVGRNMSRNTYAMGLGVGLLNQWRLTDRVALNLDVSWRAYEPDFDGAGGQLAGHGLRTKDQIVSCRLGATYLLGYASFKRVSDSGALMTLMQSQIEALNAQLADQQAENERLRSEKNTE